MSNTTKGTRPSSLIVSEYNAYRNDCRTFADAAAMFDAIHAEARTCIDNLADMALRALDRDDVSAAQTLLCDIKKHEAVRDSIEAMWQ